jgi:hypothetical protein
MTVRLDVFGCCETGDCDDTLFTSLTTIGLGVFDCCEIDGCDGITGFDCPFVSKIYF